MWKSHMKSWGNEDAVRQKEESVRDPPWVQVQFKEWRKELLKAGGHLVLESCSSKESVLL